MANDLESELKSWCRGEGLDETQALITIVTEEWETNEVEATLETIKGLGRVRVRGKKFNDKLARPMVLCESREVVKGETVPQVATEEFCIKLKGLLQAQGKTMEDLQSLFPSAPSPISSTESILAAVGDLLDKATKPAESGSYGRLR